jgi:hypothetical protein
MEVITDHSDMCASDMLPAHVLRLNVTENMQRHEHSTCHFAQSLDMLTWVSEYTETRPVLGKVNECDVGNSDIVDGGACDLLYT